MLQEHERGRECVRRMKQAIENPYKNETAFVTAAAEYIVLLRQHILKENNILFEIAEHCLSDDDADDYLLKGFSRIEEETGCPELHESYVAELKDWEEYFESEILVPY